MWINPRIVTMAKQGQTQRTAYHGIPFMHNSGETKLICSDEKIVNGCQRLEMEGERKGRRTLGGTGNCVLYLACGSG